MQEQSAYSVRLMLSRGPAKVYDRSKLFGPSTFISQFSLARDAVRVRLEELKGGTQRVRLDSHAAQQEAEINER